MRYAVSLSIFTVLLSGCQVQQAGQLGTVDWVARTIAICGAVIAACGLVLGIWNYFWDRRKFEIMRKERLDDKEERKREKDDEVKSKAEQNREKVNAELLLGSMLDGKPFYTHECKVRIYNPCPFTIHIKYVWLTFVDLDKTAKENNRVSTTVPLYAELTSELPVGGRNVPSSRVLLGSSTAYSLESRKEVFFKYNLEDSTVRLISALSSTDDVYISIVSTAGEIGRITGDEIIPGVKEMKERPAK